jgi:hypothetical protein
MTFGVAIRAYRPFRPFSKFNFPGGMTIKIECLKQIVSKSKTSPCWFTLKLGYV